MTKEKWQEIYNEELNKLSSKLTHQTLENWPYNKSVLVNFIREVNKATQVFEMENKE